MFRLKAIEHHHKSTDAKDYFFTASISADEECRLEVKRMFLDFLEKSSKVIEKAPTKVSTK